MKGNKQPTFINSIIIRIYNEIMFLLSGRNKIIFEELIIKGDAIGYVKNGVFFKDNVKIIIKDCKFI